MKSLRDLALLSAVLALIAIAALSGVWMQKPSKSDQKERDGGGDVNVYIIVPPASSDATPATTPDAKRYPV